MSDNTWSNLVISLIDSYDENKCDILIPCRIIYTLIPVMPKSSTLFENTILRLINININNPENIAKILCLEVEFVLYILNILKENMLIDNSYTITETGRQIIDELKESNKYDEVEYMVIGFIQNMLDGKLCDYLVGSNFEKYLYSKKKVYKNKKYFNIKHVVESDNRRLPNDMEYRNIISINQKYFKEIPNVGELDENRLKAVPKNYTIENTNEEKIYLHCQVNYYNNRIYVTDGYGSIAEDYIRILEDNWLKDFIENQKTEDVTGYPSIYKKYNEIEKHIIKINDLQSNNSNIKNIYYETVYSLMEHILYCIVNDNGCKYNDMIHNITSETIKEICSNIGFIIPENYEFKCDKVYKENYSFDNLISHIILLAKDDNDEKIKKLSKTHPQFILQMIELKKYRDNEAHGKKNNKLISDELQSFIKKDNIFNIVKLLLPDLEVITPSGSIITIDENLKNAIIDVRLNLGNNLYERLPENIKNNLFKIYLSKENVINNIYKTYQQFFVQIILNYDLSHEKIEKDEVLKKYQNNIDIKYYELLKNVSDDYVLKAANNSNSTLNGCLIVFMYLALYLEKNKKQFNKIKDFIDKNEDFINDVAFIIKERGHGNKLTNDTYNKEEIEKLLNYIKIFMRELYV